MDLKQESNSQPETNIYFIRKRDPEHDLDEMDYDQLLYIENSTEINRGLKKLKLEENEFANLSKKMGTLTLSNTTQKVDRSTMEEAQELDKDRNQTISISEISPSNCKFLSLTLSICCLSSLI